MKNSPEHQKLRVLHVGPLPPPYGGVGVLLKTIMESRLREACTLLHFNTQKPAQEEKPSTPTPADVLFTLVNAVRLPLMILRSHPHVIHVQSTADTGFVRDGILVLSARLVSSRIILHFHGAPDANLFPGRGFVTRLFFRLVTSRCRRVIFNTEGFRQGFKHLVSLSKSVAIPNLVSCRSFPEARHEQGDTFSVLFVGRLSVRKGFWDLLTAMVPLLAERANLRLLCMGVPEEREAAEMERIVSFLESQGVREKVGLLGRVPHGNQGVLFSKSHAFALPTHMDVFPLTVVEAMASGLPVVVTPQGAIPEIVQDGVNGFLVKEGAIVDIRDRIRYLADHAGEARRIGAHNRKVAIENFDADKRSDDFVKLYSDVASQG